MRYKNSLKFSWLVEIEDVCEGWYNQWCDTIESAIEYVQIAESKGARYEVHIVPRNIVYSGEPIGYCDTDKIRHELLRRSADIRKLIDKLE